jgi:hypothetical protein
MKKKSSTISVRGFFVLFFKRPFRETTSALMRKAGKPPDRIVSVVSTSTLILIQFIFFFLIVISLVRQNGRRRLSCFSCARNGTL